jgi:hypothetical protein
MSKIVNRVLAALLVLTIGSVFPAHAQQRKRAAPAQGEPRQESRPPVQAVAPPQSVTLVQQAAADYLSGEANVAVKGNMNPIIRLGLSPNGVTMIEFPVADRFFAIHPGNSDLVTIDDSPTKATDHFLVMRAGSGFSSPTITANAGRGPATSVIIQMQSGMVVTFLVYPVQYLAQQAHRCVVNYDRNEVVAARRAAGLAVNLDGTDGDRPRTASVRMAPASAVTADQTPNVAAAPHAAMPPAQPVIAEIDTKESPAKRDKKDGGEAGLAAHNALATAIKSPGSFKKWGAPLHGLALSLSQVREVDARTRVVVVAVRNTDGATARIVQGAPDIYVQTLDKNGNPLQVEQIRKLEVQTTAVDGAIPAGATCYYAVVYETLVLGASQRLRIAIAQINAADEPASAEMTSSRR